MKLIVLKNNVPLNEVSVDTTDLHEMYEIYVGRSEDCHVRIDDPLVSRHHFVLKNENSKWYCEKLSQLGLITLNGSIVEKTPIQSGDEIKFGVYSILVSDLSSMASEPISQISVLTEVYNEPEDHLTEVMAAPADPVQTKELDFDMEPEPLQVTEEIIPENSSVQLNGPLDDFDHIEPYNNELSESTQLFVQEPALESEGLDLALAPEPEQSSAFKLDLAPADNESTKVFKAFVNYRLIIFGEHAPYDRFHIDQEEIFIGRDQKKCQILLNDPEVSSVHAVIRKNNAEITLEDLNSSNGTILNGERINKAQLTTGDEFVIGSTSFTLEVRSDLLESEADRLMPVESGQMIETEEIEDEIVKAGDEDNLNFNSDAPLEKSIIKRVWKDPVKRKKAIYAAFILAMAWLFLDSEEPKVEKPIVVKAPEEVNKNTKPKLSLSKELENARNIAYELGVSFFEQSRYDQAEPEFQKVVTIDPDYKKVQSYLEQTRAGMARLAELENQKRAEEERIKTKKLIDELLVKAREAVEERQVVAAESYFSQIIQKDPENIEVSQLKLELEAWQKEEEKIALEKAAKETSRKRMVDSLTPGKTYYLKKEWYRAILKLEEFLRLKGSDEDLVKEASEMLSDSKNQLASELGPLLGKARSLKEGQDYKGAYEAFLEILKIEPSNTEALNEVDDIKFQLDARSKRIYREAIISESLSLFTDAKEKFQEVQQISPTDSEYYKKASDKLKDYLE